ncbi:antitoxin VbhA family protein [Microbacterium sp. NPDC057407]|uniref:antitoxin VbhA family protein n=1 Tax=Microbacterium sp. NPDC057407 TaxID=3346120 RepID=UPI003670C890
MRTHGLCIPGRAFSKPEDVQRNATKRTAITRGLAEDTLASWPLEGHVFDERDIRDAEALIAGDMTPAQLIAQLQSEYAVAPRMTSP